MKHARRAVAILLCVAAGAFTVVSVPGMAHDLSTWTKPTMSGPWAGGKVWQLDTDYLNWVRNFVNEGDRFALVDGTGNVAISQWAPYQLYPAIMVNNPAEADWIVLYGVWSADAGLPPGLATDERVYRDGYSVLRVVESGDGYVDGQ